MKVSFVDAESGRVLHVEDDLARSDLSVGDNLSIVSDQQFGREIEIIGAIIAISFNITNVKDSPSERSLVAIVKTA